jgi:hypothetical protein
MLQHSVPIIGGLQLQAAEEIAMLIRVHLTISLIMMLSLDRIVPAASGTGL